MLQAQQQQIMAQHQQYAAGLMTPQPLQPGLMPQPAPFMPAPYGQFQPQPTHRRALSTMTGTHHYSASSSGNEPSKPPSGQGHARRHSLALSEARQAAAVAQAKRSNDTLPSQQQSGSGASPTPASGSSTSQASSTSSSESPSKSNVPSFKFPSSPEKPDSGSAASRHGRSQSMQYTTKNYNRNSSPQRNYQFPSPDHHSHNRSNSRNLDSNWRQPPQQQQQPQSEYLVAPSQFVPGHRSRGSYNSSISSIQAYGLINQNQYSSGPPGTPGGNQQQRKSLFSPYLPQASLPSLLAEGRLVSGILRVNKKNRSDAYVSTDGLLDADIFICGSKDRNRALEGDLVAVELLDVDEVWSAKKEKEDKKKRKDITINSVEENRQTGGENGGLRRRGSLKQRPTQKKNDDVEVEGQSLLLVEEEALSDEIKPLYAGHVVAIIDRVPAQTFSGTLGLLRPSSQATKNKQDAERKDRGEDVSRSHHDNKPKIVWFKPTDKRVPLIAIPTDQAPSDFVENHERYADKIFIASIKRWPITSLHPFGTMGDLLGTAGDVNVEIEALLRDNNFTADVFPSNAIDSIPDSTTISEEDLSKRRSFESDYVVAFSPKDDLVEQAFHVKKLSDDKVEIGVHIVDVSHYVQENSPLDNEARKRGTSVFLKQRTVNQFPDKFNEFVSFHSGRKSLALSVVFDIDPKSFVITETWVGESVITPSKVIPYSVGQKVLDNEENTGATQAEVDYIKTLQLVATKFRQERLNLKPGVEYPPLTLLNYVDDESVVVTNNIFDNSEVQLMFDEINIKVNTAIGQKLLATLGDQAFLRRHSDPILQKIEAFIESVKNLNLDIDTTSSATIQKFILETSEDDIRKGLEALLYKCLNRAKYYVAGKQEAASYGHYLLNAPVYTHFNAPLRRYADIIVHRQLHSIISGEPYEGDISKLAGIADLCNFKKDCAKNAQEQSIHLAVCQDIDKKTVATGQLIIDAIIIQVYESAFDVLIPEYGIEKRVHGDQLPLQKAEFDKKTRLLELFWESGVDSATYVPDNEKNDKSPTPRRGRVRASSAASALAQEQGSQLEQISKLSINTDKPDIDSNKVLAPYFKKVVTRVENGEKVQEIRVLQHVPILLSAELGSSIPCLTVRAVNPFIK